MKVATYNTVDWKKYLKPNSNVRINRFLDKKGHDVFHQISLNIRKANRNGWEKIVLLIHPNAGNLMVIPKQDYLEVLNIAHNWFLEKEMYENCSTIQEIITEVKKNIN